ncbi:alpha-amylase family glycosyl hydrolase, partial [Arachnia propionica]|uniref:alpha-amylase family glycosyl hydrolase n=1 Tax=Arachnia propionica TaxID=1750 RepID=UPI0037BF3BF0
DLGITHLFCSPILQAAPGSTHGYDVVDHTRISQELGGEEGFRHLAEVAHEQGIGPGPQVGKAYKFLSGATHRARPDPSGRGEAAAAELVA